MVEWAFNLLYMWNLTSDCLKALSQLAYPQGIHNVMRLRVGVVGPVSKHEVVGLSHRLAQSNMIAQARLLLVDAQIDKCNVGVVKRVQRGRLAKVETVEFDALKALRLTLVAQAVLA